VPSPDAAPRVLSAYAKLLLGGVLEEKGAELGESISLLKDSLTVFSATLGDEAELVALARLALAMVLASAGQYEDAEANALRTRDMFDKALPANHYARGLSKLALGRLRIEQRRHAEAQSLLKDAVNLCRRDNACPLRLRSEFLWTLGRAYSEEGRGRAAIEAFRSSLDIQEKVLGAEHPLTLHARIGLAEALRQAGSPDEAMAVLDVSHAIMAALETYQQAKGDLYRTHGLLLLQKEEFDPAIWSLERSSSVVTRRLGADHWRATRARLELEAAKQAAAIRP
jgi:tetratricopeptide (TPR) repeat protein